MNDHRIGVSPPEVEGHPAQEQGVAGDPVQLSRQHPDVLRAPRHLDVEQLLERHDAGPFAEEGADVLEGVEIADRLVVVGVLAQLLDAAVEVAEDRIEVDDLLAVELEHDAQHAVGRGMLRSHVEEHLAVAERVELGLALGPRRVRRDGLEDTRVLVELDARVVRRAGEELVLLRGTGSWCSRGHRRSFMPVTRRCAGRVRPSGSRVAGGCAPWAGHPPRASVRHRRRGRSPCEAGSSRSREACRSGAGRGCPRT